MNAVQKVSQDSTLLAVGSVTRITKSNAAPITRRKVGSFIAAAVGILAFGLFFAPASLPTGNSTAVAASRTVTVYYSVYYYHRRYPRNVFYYDKYTSLATAQRVASQINSPVYYAYVRTTR